MAKVAFDVEERLGGYRFKPGVCKIYGLDVKGEVGKHLWVPDAEDAPSKELIDSIRAEGIRTPICVQKIGDDPFIVFGRNREKAARWLLKHENIEILVPAINVERGTSQAEVMVRVISENLARKKVSAYDVMEQIAFFTRMNGDDKESLDLLSRTTGLDPKRIDKLLSVRESPVALKALKDGDLDIEGAIAIAGIAPSEQASKLDELKVEAAARGKQKVTVEAARAAKAGRKPRPSGRVLERVCTLLQTRGATGNMLDIIRWAAGRGSLERTPEEFRDAVKTVLSGKDKEEVKALKKAERDGVRALKKKRRAA